MFGSAARSACSAAPWTLLLAFGLFFPNGLKQTERSFEVVSSETERRGEFFIVVSTKQITLNKCC